MKMSRFSVIASIVAVLLAIGTITIAVMLFLSIGVHASWSLHAMTASAVGTSNFWSEPRNWMQTPIYHPV